MSANAAADGEVISAFAHGGARAGAGGARANAGGARPGAGRKPNPPPLAYADIARWYCVRTGFGAEITADIQIRLAGFALFNPSLWKPATRARRDRNGSIRPASSERIVPLFPRYLFVRFRRVADPWRPIWRLPGVECILSSSAEMPTPVPDGAIDAIRGLCAPNECVYPDNERMLDGRAPAIRAAPIEAGTRAWLTTGPLADLAGICTWSDGKRVRLLLQIMGRAVPVSAAQTAVETGDRLDVAGSP